MDSTRSGIVEEDLDIGDRAFRLEIDLRGFERHEDETGIVFEHADLEQRAIR